MKFALRSLLKTPGFTVVALLTLALGIGLNTAMFNIVNSLVLRPLSFPDSDRLFRLQRFSPQQNGGGNRAEHFLEISRLSGDLAELACSRPWSFTFSEGNQPPEILGSLRASAGYFHVLGLPMVLGREFLPAEDQPGRNQVVVLSHSFWVTHFNADPEIVGRVIRLDGQPNAIIGVASPLARDSRTVGTPEIYRPLALNAGEIARIQNTVQRNWELGEGMCTSTRSSPPGNDCRIVVKLGRKQRWRR